MVKTRTAYIANLSTEDLGSAVDARLPSHVSIACLITLFRMHMRKEFALLR